MVTKFKMTPRKIGDSYYILIPNDFIKFGSINTDKEQNIIIEEV